MAFTLPIALDYLRRAQTGGRLGHSYLLIGGDSAFTLAREFAALVLNTGADAALTHPDVYLVEPESKSRRIRIDQMRELEGSLQLRAGAVGGRKVGIVRDADRLTTEAANSFLKTLEEPPSQSLLLLVSALPESLPETILSRCIKVVLLEDATTAKPRSLEEKAVGELLARYAQERPVAGEPSVAAGYLFLREFTQLLGAARARVQEESEAALKREQEQYAKTTDGSWLDEREAYHKGISDARYLAERARLVELLAGWWRDVLRQQTTADTNAPSTNGHGASAFAGRIPTHEILRRLSTLNELRENLERNVHEPLALEAAFLQVFGM